MRATVWAAVCAVIPLSLGATRMPAQVITVQSDISCARCSIELVRVGTIASDMITGPPWIITRLSGHRYLVKGQDDGGELHVFSISGNWLHQVGRAGAGPGEYQGPLAAELAPGDSLWIHDPANARISVLSPSLRYVRALPLDANVSGAVIFGSDLSVVHAQIRTPEAAGFTLHRRESGNASVPFGSERQEFRADDFGLNRRTIIRGAGRTVWAAHYQAYIIESWALDGTMVARIIRDADWFRPQVKPPTAQPDQPPLPKITGISYDSASDHLWTSVIVADADYRAAFGSVPRGIEGRMLYPVVDRTRLYDTVIEVIDVQAGRVLARRRIGDTVLRWTAHDEFVTYSEDSRGRPRIDIWRVRLQRGERRVP